MTRRIIFISRLSKEQIRGVLITYKYELYYLEYKLKFSQ